MCTSFFLILSSFESYFITLQLFRSTISVFNIYRPSLSSTLSKQFFNSFISFAATTPHDHRWVTLTFILILDNPTYHFNSQFLSLLSSFNLSQHVNFPAHHNKNHIFDLVITSSDSSLALSLSFAHCSPSDHFPVFTKLSTLLVKRYSRHHQTLQASIQIQPLVHLYHTSLQILCSPRWESLERHPLCYRLVLFQVFAQPVGYSLSHPNNPSTPT